MELHKVYFWTSTIKDWNKLLEIDEYKSLLINCLTLLVEKKKITVCAFVIMPNHIHIVWELDEFNGKEMPHANFNKFTAHEIVKDLKNDQPNSLSHFKVDEKERQYRIWQRDPLAILMDSKKKVEQKIDYIHNNPLNQRWNLTDAPESYYWSSAKYYEDSLDDLGFLTHYTEAF